MILRLLFPFGIFDPRTAESFSAKFYRYQVFDWLRIHSEAKFS